MWKWLRRLFRVEQPPVTYLRRVEDGPPPGVKVDRSDPYRRKGWCNFLLPKELVDCLGETSAKEGVSPKVAVRALFEMFASWPEHNKKKFCWECLLRGVDDVDDGPIEDVYLSEQGLTATEPKPESKPKPEPKPAVEQVQRAEKKRVNGNSTELLDVVFQNFYGGNEMLRVEELEDRCVPVVHSFSAAAGVSPSANAGGTPANPVVIEALGGIPAPVVAVDWGAEGVPFETNHVPGEPRK